MDNDLRRKAIEALIISKSIIMFLGKWDNGKNCSFIEKTINELAEVEDKK